jgi:hypothetical protein
MGFAEVLRLVPKTSFGRGGAGCGRILREDRGAPSGWIAFVPAKDAGPVGSSQTKSGGRFTGPVNTSATLVGAAARSFLRLGATRVVIGEGPGHQRDTELVVQSPVLKPHLSERQIEFVDLNRHRLRNVKLKVNYRGLKELWLSGQILMPLPTPACRTWKSVSCARSQQTPH